MRIEKDDFGTVQIDDDVLYGIQTIRTKENLTFSKNILSEYKEYIRSLVYVKKATALANFEDNVISRIVKEKIVDACDTLLQGQHLEQFVVDVYHGGGGIGINMNINEVIANLCNEAKGIYSIVHPIDHVNASQSTSDVCHTAIRLAINEAYEKLAAETADLIATMNRKTNEFMPIATISRTCLQDASRMQLGEKFSGFESVIKRRHKKLTDAVEELLTINLGGTVIGKGEGASTLYKKIIIQKLKEVTELPVSRRENLFDAAQNIDDLVDVSKQLSLFASALLKIAKDLRLLSSGPEAGFAEILLPAIQAGSSFYPGKVNPVIPETVIQCCAEIIGIERVIQATFEHGDLDLNVFENFAGIHLLDGIYMLTKCIHNFRKQCFEGIIANEARCDTLANSRIPQICDLKEKFGYSETIRLLNEQGINEEEK
ncbi:lyase family protein [Solibacillus sp. FSL K6-1523]|uniref:lyase family protein n=1 Tax=Solibacillus sp. FSL K6-1523 TaxID=2921471 RepID=UPI0030F7C036